MSPEWKMIASKSNFYSATPAHHQTVGVNFHKLQASMKASSDVQWQIGRILNDCCLMSSRTVEVPDEKLVSPIGNFDDDDDTLSVTVLTIEIREWLEST